MACKYIPIFFDWIETTADLTQEQKGKLIDALVSYASEERDAETILESLTVEERVAFRFLKGQIDRNDDISAKRRKARKKDCGGQTAEGGDQADPSGTTGGDQADPSGDPADADDDQTAADNDFDHNAEQNGTKLTKPANNNNNKNNNKNKNENKNEKENKKEKDHEDENEIKSEEKNKSEEKVNTRKKFVKPTQEEVAAYCRERNNGLNPQQFVDFYESKGWKVGDQPMQDWRACVRTWENNRGKGGGKTVYAQQFTQRDYSGEQEAAMMRMIGAMGE